MAVANPLSSRKYPGMVTIIDDLDYDLVTRNKWRAHRQRDGLFYAIRTRTSADPPGTPLTVYLHRVIANTPNGSLTDHRDRDGLNNQRSNLRTATKRQNGCNCPNRVHNTSGYRGVRQRGNGWVAQITAFRRNHYLGYFHTPEEAARAYDRKAREFHGEFATTNFGEAV